jgi:predicted NBD/HSP70 family sugar kinase
MRCPLLACVSLVLALAACERNHANQGLTRDQILVIVEDIDDAARAGDAQAVSALAARLHTIGSEAFALTAGLLDSSQPRVRAIGVGLLRCSWS